MLQSPSTRLPVLHSFSSLRDLNSLAHMLRTNPLHIIDATLIQKAIISDDIALILTFYFHNKFAQAIIEHIALKPEAIELQKKLSNYKTLFQNISIRNDIPWENTLYAHLNKWDDWCGDTPLHTAIRQHDEDKVSALIQQGMDPYAKNQRGITPIHLAATLPTTGVLQQMAEVIEAKDKATRSWISRVTWGWGLDVSLFDNDGETPMHVAAQNPQPEILQWMFKSVRTTSEDKNMGDKHGFTPLHHAVLANLPENIKTLLDHGANESACAKKHVLEHILKNPQSFDEPLTPLWLALEKRNFNVVSLLISSSDDLFDVTNSSGMTAVHLAAFLGKADQLLLWKEEFDLTDTKKVVEIKVTVPLYDNHQRTPLHYAALADELDSFKILLDDYPICDQDTEGNQPLHYACTHPSAQVAKYIVEEYQREQKNIQNSSWITNLLKEETAVADINARNNHGITPYMLANQLKNSIAMESLEKAGCDKTTLGEQLYQAISKPEFRQGEPSEQEALIAKFASPILDLIKSSDNATANAMHLCAMHLNYRMALILLHPLSLAERQRLCSAKNEAEKTPLMLLKESYERVPPESQLPLKEFYEKFRRLLLRYTDRSRILGVMSPHNNFKIVIHE